jgi:AhpD family alkylhydroperoxidase
MAQQTELTGENTSRVVEMNVAAMPDGKRAAIFKEIEATLGIVPGFMKMMPPTHLEAEWKLFKDFALSDKTALDPLTKELIGLGVAAQMACPYCVLFHTAGAAMHGATPEQINEAVLMTKHSAGWSRYFHGMNYDLEQFRREMKAIGQHMKRGGGQVKHS